ncbi:hypothetical protein [Bordetella pertussis]|nr:hypothetical protein [Bordetella pertussis]
MSRRPSSALPSRYLSHKVLALGSFSNPVRMNHAYNLLNLHS